MLPKKGDIGILTLGDRFCNERITRDGWAKMKIIKVTNSSVEFELIDSYNFIWDTMVGTHMFIDPKFGTWSCKESNVLNLLKRVDEISEGTT